MTLLASLSSPNSAQVSSPRYRPNSKTAGPSAREMDLRQEDLRPRIESDVIQLTATISSFTPSIGGADRSHNRSPRNLRGFQFHEPETWERASLRFTPESTTGFRSVRPIIYRAESPVIHPFKAIVINPPDVARDKIHRAKISIRRSNLSRVDCSVIVSRYRCSLLLLLPR